MRERKREALGRIFERYHLRLRRLATKALRSKDVPEQEYDADDLLDSALDVLLRLVLQGRVESIRGVDGFWRLYRRILAHKVSAAWDRRSALKRPIHSAWPPLSDTMQTATRSRCGTR